eukprot:358198-Chlamydomonas_euryale.AAC.5
MAAGADWCWQAGWQGQGALAAVASAAVRGWGLYLIPTAVAGGSCERAQVCESCLVGSTHCMYARGCMHAPASIGDGPLRRRTMQMQLRPKLPWESTGTPNAPPTFLLRPPPLVCACAASIAIVYDPQPTPKHVKGTLATKTVARIASGHNHSIAVDTEVGALAGWCLVTSHSLTAAFRQRGCRSGALASVRLFDELLCNVPQGACYSWGNGGYGRLGHRVQQDEMEPRKLEDFKARLFI